MYATSIMVLLTENRVSNFEVSPFGRFPLDNQVVFKRYNNGVIGVSQANLNL